MVFKEGNLIRRWYMREMVVFFMGCLSFLKGLGSFVFFNIYFLMKEYIFFFFGVIKFWIVFFIIRERGGFEFGFEELILGSREFRRLYEEILVE